MSRTGLLVLMLVANAEWIGAKPAGRTVRVIVINQAELDARQLEASLGVVERLYVGTEIDFAWCTAAPCVGVADSAFLVVRLLDTKGASKLRFPKSALGLAEGSTAFVALGKVDGVAVRTGLPVKAVLAAVIAHEIGHLLLGPEHSAFGLMGPECESGHLDIARRGGRAFNDGQVRKMQTRLANLAGPLPY